MPMMRNTFSQLTCLYQLALVMGVSVMCGFTESCRARARFAGICSAAMLDGGMAANWEGAVMTREDLLSQCCLGYELQILQVLQGEVWRRSGEVLNKRMHARADWIQP